MLERDKQRENWGKRERERNRELARKRKRGKERDIDEHFCHKMCLV